MFASIFAARSVSVRSFSASALFFAALSLYVFVKSVISCERN